MATTDGGEEVAIVRGHFDSFVLELQKWADCAVGCSCRSQR
jgi:hypothetical protein